MKQFSENTLIIISIYRGCVYSFLLKTLNSNTQNKQSSLLTTPWTNLVSIVPSGVRALPLAAGINEGGHYFRYIFLLLLLATVIQNPRRGCRRVSNFCMGS